MTSKFGLVAAALLLSGTAAAPAWAQEVPTQLPVGEAAIETGDSFTIGAGAAYRPSYEGSDDYKIGAAAAARGRIGGFGFWTRGTSLFIDLIPESGGGIDFSAGPVAGVRLNRTGGIKDDQVKALGELKTAWEVGGFVGIAKTGVITSAYDTLGVRVSYEKDVGNAHESHVITPAIEYGTPLSRKAYVALSASADFVGDGYASYYFDVSPDGALASGLLPFEAEGGFKSWSIGLLGTIALSGDLRRGLMLVATGSYSRLQNDFRRSPITSDAGSPNQWLAAVGIGYTF